MNIRIVEPHRLIQVCGAISHGFTDFVGVCEFIFEKPTKKISSGDKTHISRAISAARDLGMISFIGSVKDGRYDLITSNGFDPRSWTVDDQKLFFREKLQKFEPFLRYFDFVSHGFSHASAAARVSSLLKIDPALSGEGNILRKWGEFARVFDDRGVLAPTVATAKVARENRFVGSLLAGLDSELKSRNFLQEWLGEEVFKFIDEDIREDLVFALTYYDNDPEGSMTKLGNALEDHIKALAKKRGLKLEDSKGKPLTMIGQMISHLRSQKVLADHHSSSLRGLEVFVATDVLNGFNAFRKMGAHGKNVDAEQRWSLGPEIALVMTLQTILAIRSTYNYVVKDKLSY